MVHGNILICKFRDFSDLMLIIMTFAVQYGGLDHFVMSNALSSALFRLILLLFCEKLVHSFFLCNTCRQKHQNIQNIRVGYPE